MPYQATRYGRPLHILHVEDDDGDARAVERSFRKANLINPIRRAVDGLEGLDILIGAHGQTRLPCPGLVLLDLEMPRMNGVQLIRELRQLNASEQCIVFLVTSPTDQKRLAALDLDLKVADYVAKDLNGRDVLIERLTACV